MAGTRWLPLESNPEVMNKYVASLGMCTDSWQFTDIYGLDPDLLMMVPRPVTAVLLLYPITEKSETEKLESEKGEKINPGSPYFMKQTIGNACGTIGLFHALLNNWDKLNIPNDSVLGKFYDSTKEMSPSERASHMESSTDIGAAHEESANEGQTAAPDRADKTDFHFVCFVCKDGKLFQLDGRKDDPIHHGATTEDTLLEDACAVVKEFMKRDPDNLKFTMVALAKA